MEGLILSLIEAAGPALALSTAASIAVITWALAHFTAQPGTQISVLWGLVTYTKRFREPGDPVVKLGNPVEQSKELSNNEPVVKRGDSLEQSEDFSNNERMVDPNNLVEKSEHSKNAPVVNPDNLVEHSKELSSSTGLFYGAPQYANRLPEIPLTFDSDASSKFGGTRSFIVFSRAWAEQVESLTAGLTTIQKANLLTRILEDKWVWLVGYLEDVENERKLKIRVDGISCYVEFQEIPKRLYEFSIADELQIVAKIHKYSISIAEFLPACFFEQVEIMSPRHSDVAP